MKKILFVMHALDFGGAERSMINLLGELPEEKYEVDVLLFQRRGGLLAQVPGWVRILETPEELNGLYAPLRRAGRFTVVKIAGTFCSRLVRRTRKKRAAWRWRYFYSPQIKKLDGMYDVAVAFTGVEIMYYVAEKVKASRKLVFIHNDYHTAGYSAEDDEPYFAQMDGIVSISEQCVNVLKETFKQHAEKVHYLQNITSSELVRRRAAAFIPEEYSREEINLLSVGRLWPQKGFDMAINAAAILRDNGMKFRWFVLGEGDLRETLQRQIDTLGLRERFVLMGAKENPYPYMKHCDILVQSSRYEGKSVVLDEAKMLCTPIVVTAYPTVNDQIIDGKEGIITEMSAQGIAEGIIRLMKEPERREELKIYLSEHEYGNQDEVYRYMELFDE